MSLSSVSINRPVLATVMSLVIVLLGVIGYSFLGVREYPSVDAPKVTVTTSYTGANAEVIESQITEPLEEEINTIAGIRTLTSVSRNGRSTITAEFDLERNLENAANDVRDKVSRAINNLPADADPPEVEKADAAQEPIIFLNIKSEKRSLLELTEIADRRFKEQIQTINGVSQVMIWGEQKYSMRLWMDPEKMAAHQVTPSEVKQALDEQNIELPSGRIEGKSVELTVRTLGRLYTEEEFNNLIIRESGNEVVRFKDIGTAELGPENMRTVLKRDGTPMVGNAIVPQPGANQIAIAKAFYDKLEKIKEDLPPDIKTGIGFDKTNYIQQSIDEVQQTVFVAFGLVVCIIFLFLRDWRTTIIPVVVIPIALIGSFFIMYAMGYSINVLTLLGIVLAIGLVVDDAIVMLENIYTKIEQGEKPQQAAKRGSTEIFFAILATTIALVAVFTPVIFLQGITGRLFQEFGVVLAGSVVISSFVALTFTPMLSSKILKRRERQNWLYRKTEPFFLSLNNGYKQTLEAFLKLRWLAFVVILLAVGGIFYIGREIPEELAPVEDRGNLRIFTQGPEGATFEYMDNYMDRLINLLKKEVPEREAIISVTSPGFRATSSVNSGFVRLKLSDAPERKRSQGEIANDLRQKLDTLNGARAFITQEQSISTGSSGQPVEFVIQATNLNKLKEVLPKFLERARKHEAFSFVDSDLKFNKPELQVHINRDKAKKVGVSTANIARNLQLALSGQRYGYFLKDGKQYQVIGQLHREDRNEPVDLTNLYVRNESGKLVQLDNLVTMKEVTSPPQLFHFNRYTSATVGASLNEGVKLGEGIEAMREVADKTLDNSFSTALRGTSRDFIESSSSLQFAFLLALILIYLVLSAQFESFRAPAIVMFTVPLAMTGALLALYVFDETLNIFSQIGIIMLIGLVTKNGILIVEFANQYRDSGLSVLESAREAAVARFRPILMTTISTILGVLPIALALGAGSESRVSIGIAVIGGLIFATLLTLYVIPAFYSYIASPYRRMDPSEN